MKWIRLFLLFLLIPILTYGMNEDQCQKICGKINKQWHKSNLLIEQLNDRGPSQDEAYVDLLKQVIGRCEKGIRYCDKILNDIAKQPKRKRKTPWRQEMKRVIKQNKTNFSSQLLSLQEGLKAIELTLGFGKANTLFQESEKKAILARDKQHECQRTLTNSDRVIATLNEGATLYAEAAKCAWQALSLIASSDDTKGKATLQKTAETYQAEANRCKKEADEWPETISAQKNILRERGSISTTRERAVQRKGAQAGRL